MEDQVPFKVFTHWNSDTKPEVRRFGVEKSVVTSFHYLNAKLQEIYPGLRGRHYAVTWKDEDDDDVNISSDDELMTALTAFHGNLIKLNIHVTGEQEKEELCNAFIGPVVDNPHVPCDMTHYNVTCDGCNTGIVGFRYKCTSCYDFDLCSKCESAGLHPEHLMVRLPSPAVPRALLKAAIKRSRHFLKTVATPPGDDGHKRHRRDKSTERRHHSDRRGDYARRPRTSWLETFTSYMNEFANLAGDIDLNKPQNPNAEEKKPAEPANTSQPSNAQASTSAGQSNEKPTANANFTGACPILPGLENIPKLIEMYVNGNLATYLQQAATAANANANASEAQASSANDNDVEMREGTPKPQEANIKVEPSSTSDETVRDSSPDKADGWTLINKEKDLLDTSNNPSAPTEPAAPIGFNLPEEFQERVRINEGQNIYPPLNAATAVMNPKEPEKPQMQTPLKPTPAPAPTSQRPAQPQQPQPPQRPRHPLAHVEAAIEQMILMGFTNEGGWLTNLLEKNDGNIAAVLDLLTPPKI